MADPLWIGAGKNGTVGTATIAAATDLLTIAGHGLIDGQTVTVDALTGGAVGVLVPDAVYFVRDATADTFGLSLTVAGPLVVFATDGGADVHQWAPQYHAQELRRAQSVLLSAGGGTTFGARQGLHPADGTAKVSIAGSTITVGALKAVVYPGLTSLSGPYLVALPQEQHTLSPADGSNPRIDGVDLQVQDDDEDASGFRRARTVYVVGTPAGSPIAPPVSATSMRLATILVPPGGSPAPTVTNVYALTTAVGGIIPSELESGLPPEGRYEGMYADQRDIETLRRFNGSAWESVASVFVHDHAGVVLETFNGGDGTNVTTVFNNIDQGFLRLMVIWRGRNDASNVSTSLSLRFNGDGGNNYWSQAVHANAGAWTFTGNANTTSIRIGSTGSQLGTHGVFWLPIYAGGSTKSASGVGHTRGINASSTDNGWASGGGYWVTQDPITSIQLWPTGQLWLGNLAATLIGFR